MFFFPETRLNPQILRFEVFSQTFDLSWRPYLVGSSAAASMTFFLFRPGKVCFEGVFPTNFTDDLMDASLFFTTVRLGSMTVMILHPQNLQNWCVFIPTFCPFRWPIAPFWSFLGYPCALLFQDGLLGQECPSWPWAASVIPDPGYVSFSAWDRLEKSRNSIKAFFLNSASSGNCHVNPLSGL